MSSPTCSTPILVIAGPTASGKTSAAVETALSLGGELVGADSMQVYRGFDVGTAKPDAQELRGVRHHLLDVVDPEQAFDAAHYVPLADLAIREIDRRNARVIVVGGTGLYLRALLHGLHPGPPPCLETRKKVLARVEEVGWPALHDELSRKDPKSASRLHPNDGVRILRALEVWESSGIPMSTWQEGHRFLDWRYKALILGIERPRDELNQRIDKRVDQMVQGGFVEEVEGLLAAGCQRNLKPMQALGYRRIAQHLAGELDLEQAVEATKIDTHRFAKRQMTWFKKEKGLIWVKPDFSEIIERASRFWSEVNHPE